MTIQEATAAEAQLFASGGNSAPYLGVLIAAQKLRAELLARFPSLTEAKSARPVADLTSPVASAPQTSLTAGVGYAELRDAVEGVLRKVTGEVANTS